MKKYLLSALVVAGLTFTGAASAKKLKFQMSSKAGDWAHTYMAKPVRSDHVDAYGPWAWVAGMALAAFITWLMFYIADGFS